MRPPQLNGEITSVGTRKPRPIGPVTPLAVGRTALRNSSDFGSETNRWYLSSTLFDAIVERFAPGAWYTFHEMPAVWRRSGIVVHVYLPAAVTIDSPFGAKKSGSPVGTGPPATPMGSIVAVME